MKLELKDLSVNLSGKEILKSINLTVEDGEFIALLGSSGCGKSTLLKTIAGLVDQDSGDIFLSGKNANKVVSHKRGTVIVFQDFRLFPHMTVGENISFPMKMAGIKKDIYLENTRELLKKVELEGYLNRSIDEISGGQMQRVALARALAANPSVLLLDEPFSSLDSNLKKHMRNLVTDLQKEYKITTILVTHNKEEALTMSNRIAFMDKGEIIQYASPKLIFSQPINKTIANYFSDGNYISGSIKNKIFSSPYFQVPANREDGNYSCFIRPFALEIEKSKNSSFHIVDKVYKGSSFLVKLACDKSGLVFETTVDESLALDLGQALDLKIKEDQLIFIKED